jgi:allophanate hydrolase
MSTPEARAAEVLARVDAADRPEVWIHRSSPGELAAAFASVDARTAAGEELPLAGRTFAVKDNIDVAGVPTTAACPAFASVPTATAPAVQALLDAGAVLVGKTNLDQFATGLVGTRSPYGAVRNAVDPDRVSGGSSSGSAVAVALGQVDLALGTDTAGSGRVPAAFNGIVGVKPTRGLVSTEGVVPACASFDCVSVFARSVDLAERALAVLVGPAPDPTASGPGPDPFRRMPPPTAPLGPPALPVVARIDPGALTDVDPGYRWSYEQAVERLEAAGCGVVTIELDPFLEAGRLLYQGGFLAERHAAVGAWMDAHPGDVDPVVGAIIAPARDLSAVRLATDTDRLAHLAARVAALLGEVGACSLVLPTVPFHPTLAQVAADPIGINARLGVFTNFVNLLDLCAVAVPSDPVDGLPCGVSLIGPAWSDRVQAELARRATSAADPADPAPDDAWVRPALPAVPLAVAGAHLSGQPLNHQLTDRGARLVRTTTTAPVYRLVALATEPPKPGLVRVADGDAGGTVEVEVWEVPPAGFAGFVAALPRPMAIGKVILADGTSVPGFLCEPEAIVGAVDITAAGGWRAYLAGG